MIKPKHIPIRTCVACRTSDAKRGLLRVVRQPDGSVAYDPKGKMPGRGAYVCAQAACIALARKQKKLERSLKASAIPASLYQELELHTLQLDREAAATGMRTLPVINDADCLADATPQVASAMPQASKAPENAIKVESVENCGMGRKKARSNANG